MHMHVFQRTIFSLIAVLIAVGGSFNVMGAIQSSGAMVAQPGGDLPGDPNLQLVQVATGLIDPINATNANDGTGRIFVIERVGRIRVVDNGQLLEQPFLDISDTVKIDFLEQGLLGLAFHPDYETNGRFFVFYSDYQTNGDHFLVEYSVSPDDPNMADPVSAKVLLTIDDPYVNHNGGTMHFGPDGYLYLAVGDGGLAGDPYDRSQAVDDLLGNILRLDLDSEGPAPYGIPAENPFANGGVQESGVADAAAQDGSYHPSASPEIFAWGLRNPWQFSFDPATGDLYIADVGQIAWEEINFIPAADVVAGGQDFGWDHMEASHCYPPDAAGACGTFGVLPVAEFAHGEAGCSITGIGVYRGEISPTLDGTYFSSDFCSGKVWGLARDDAGAWQYEELFDAELNVTGAGQGENGELYMTACSCQFGRTYNPFENPTGTLWQLVSSDQVPEGAITAQPQATMPKDNAAATPEG